nr:AAA family ATPase [Hyphomicrobiales bacterium]
LARADHVDRMDTHGAVIFLAGDRAYKLKRAIKLAYLDFSTIEKRRSALENELRLNSRTAPEIYRRLLPVWRDGGGGLHLAGRYGAEAQIIDWVLEMNRFDQVNLLDRRAAEGRLDPALLEMLAGTIRGFHNISPSVPGANWPDSLRKVAETVRDALGNEAFAQLALAPSICALDDALARNDAFMRKRRRQGFVRRCHGDLHLKNIVLVEGKPRLFDALEFDEELARIDIIYDLAFLLMDLWSRGLKSEASALLNHYFMNATHGNELDGLRLMPMMMAIRAGVRAMVGLDELAVADDASRERRYSDMIGYARLFVELLTPEKPRLVAIGGLSGTGKTTIARAVSPEVGVSPGAMHVRSDVERKLLFHADMLERLSPGCYTDSATKLVYHRMFTKAEAILRAGHSVILDATFAPGQARMDLAGLAERSGVPLETIWLCADQNEMMNRVSARVGDASDADATIVARQVESIGMSEPAGWRCVEASGSRDAAIENVRRVLDDR